MIKRGETPTGPAMRCRCGTWAKIDQIRVTSRYFRIRYHDKPDRTPCAENRLIPIPTGTGIVVGPP